MLICEQLLCNKSLDACYLVPIICTYFSIIIALHIPFEVTTSIWTQNQVFEPFSILGLEPGASDNEIKKAYRRLSIQYHPDKNPDPGDSILLILLRYFKLIWQKVIRIFFSPAFSVIMVISKFQLLTNTLWSPYRKLTRLWQIQFPGRILKNMGILMVDR